MKFCNKNVHYNVSTTRMFYIRKNTNKIRILKEKLIKKHKEKIY